MGLLEGLNSFISFYIDTFRGLGRFKIVFPMLLYALCQFFLLFAVVNFYRPPFDGILVPPMISIFGEQITHYPNLYSVLNNLFGQVNLPLSFIIGTLLSGMTVFLFASFFDDKKLKVGSSFMATISKYHLLLLIWMIETIIVFALVIIPTELFREILSYSLKRQLAFKLILSFMGTIGTMLFVFTTAEIVLARSSFFRALANNFRILKDNIFLTFFLVFIPVMIRFPLDFLNDRSGSFTGKFNPEFIAILIGIGIIIAFVANILLIGGITRLYVAERK
jgi:hypothetical protein